jgi:hypothetical protein
MRVSLLECAHRTGWINGDFDYDGNVTSNDYFLIDRACLGQQGVIAAPDGAAIAGSMTVVPEPAGMISLIASMWGSRDRRRRG